MGPPPDVDHRRMVSEAPSGRISGGKALGGSAGRRHDLGPEFLKRNKPANQGEEAPQEMQPE